MSTLTSTRTTPTSVKAGWVVTSLVSIFFAFDVISHLTKPQVVKDSFKDLGLPLDVSVTIALILAVSLALYLVPGTNFLGAVLLTGYLGGAMAMQLRIEAPLFSTLLFPVYVGVAVWAGLWLRDERVREVMPVRRDR